MNSSTSFSGTSIQNFLLTNTNCNGKEEFLKDCMRTGSMWEIVQTCPGPYVAEVICEGKEHDDNMIQYCMVNFGACGILSRCGACMSILPWDFLPLDHVVAIVCFR